jgi:hypothetical protein
MSTEDLAKYFDRDRNDDAEIAIGETVSLSYKLKEASDLEVDDMELILTNEEAFHRSGYVKEGISKTLAFNVTSLNAGETYAYLQSKDGKIKTPETKIVAYDTIGHIQNPDGNLIIGVSNTDIRVEITGITRTSENDRPIMVLRYTLTNMSDDMIQPAKLIYENVYQNGFLCAMSSDSQYSKIDKVMDKSIEPGDSVEVQVVYGIKSLDDDVTLAIRGVEPDGKDKPNEAIITLNIDKNNEATPHVTATNY